MQTIHQLDELIVVGLPLGSLRQFGCTLFGCTAISLELYPPLVSISSPFLILISTPSLNGLYLGCGPHLFLRLWGFSRIDCNELSGY